MEHISEINKQTKVSSNKICFIICLRFLQVFGVITFTRFYGFPFLFDKFGFCQWISLKVHRPSTHTMTHSHDMINISIDLLPQWNQLLTVFLARKQMSLTDLAPITMRWWSCCFGKWPDLLLPMVVCKAEN